MGKHTQTIRRLLLTNFLSVCDHLVGLVLKGLGLLHSSTLGLMIQVTSNFAVALRSKHLVTF